MKKIILSLMLMLWISGVSLGSYGITHYDPTWEDVVMQSQIDSYRIMSLGERIKFVPHSSGYHQVFFKTEADYNYVVSNHSSLFYNPIGGTYWHSHPNSSFRPTNGVNIYYNNKQASIVSLDYINNKYPSAYGAYLNYIAVSCANLAKDYKKWNFQYFFVKPWVIEVQTRLGTTETWLGWDDGFWVYAMPAEAFMAKSVDPIQGQLTTSTNLLKNTTRFVNITTNFSTPGSEGIVNFK